MTSGFKANVSARKPRTAIGRVLSELTTASDPSEANGVPAAELDPSLESQVSPDVRPPAEMHAQESSANGHAPKSAPVTRSRASTGRERLSELRERLALAAQPATGTAEPKRTAEAVREAVESLRARLEAAARERSDLMNALEEARAALGRVQAELQKEKKARAAVEAQAEARRRIADDAVAEAEALAAERDQILAELAEQRRLEEDQNAFLAEAEVSIAQRVAEREAAARELSEARQVASVRAGAIADLEFRLEAESTERVRAQARCRELETENARLAEAHEALESIDALVARGR